MTSDTEISSDDLSFWNRRNLEFRVLILGRANAGKTTILERLTGASIYEAEVWRDGKLLAGQTIKGQSDRGLHNVDDEIRFRSRPGFVFHDSRGFEAGSSEELSTVRQFVENRSSAVTSLRTQLHAIWMCLPLDDSRELFETEREPFRWSKGAAPLVVIFTKRDGAVSKETSQIIDQIIKDSPESTVSRAVRKEARTKADFQVTNRVNEREGELRRLSLADDALAFLTTSGMEEPTVDSDKACQKLIDLMEECLTGPRVKTLLSVVWGRNLSKCGFWCVYWILRRNHKNAIKLGSGTPDTHEMIGKVVVHMMCHDVDYDDDDDGYFYAADVDYDDDDHHRRVDYDDDVTNVNGHITRLKSALCPVFHMYAPSLNDVEVLTLAVLVLVLMRAVHTQVLSSTINRLPHWISAISFFLEHHHDLVQDKVRTISSQVAAIVGEIKNRNTISQVKIVSAWKFSDEEEANKFAAKLSRCVEDNLM